MDIILRLRSLQIRCGRNGEQGSAQLLEDAIKEIEKLRNRPVNEPPGCPTPGACSCIQQDQPSDSYHGQPKDGPCAICGELTDSLGGNPAKWVTPLPTSAEPGVMKPHHMGCVLDALRPYQRPHVWLGCDDLTLGTIACETWEGLDSHAADLDVFDRLPNDIQGRWLRVGRRLFEVIKAASIRV